MTRMAFVPGYLNDVFISYVRDDNDAADNLIAAFRDELTKQLKAQGVRNPAPSIFFDASKALDGQDVERQFMSNARLSAVFFAFWSKSYSQSRYCKREWEAFTQSNQDLGGRLFVGELAPDVRDEAARTLGCPTSPLTIGFHYADDAGTSYTMTPEDKNLEGKDLRRIAIDAAREIAVKLNELRTLMLDASQRPPRAVIFGPTAMAMFCDDLATRCCQSRVFTLDPTGQEVLRQMTRPDSSNELQPWLGEADLALEIIDPANPVPITPLPAGKPVLRWLRRDAGTPADKLEELRKDDRLKECSLQEFHDAVVKLAQQLRWRPVNSRVPAPAPAPAAPAVAGAPTEEEATADLPPLVLIISHPNDSDRAVPLQDSLYHQGVQTDLTAEIDAAEASVTGPPAINTQVVSQHAARIKELLAVNPHASGIVFVDGQTTPEWIDNRWRGWSLLRLQLPTLCLELDPLPKQGRKRRMTPPYYLNLNDASKVQAFIDRL
jgi:hypothetical protein